MSLPGFDVIVMVSLAISVACLGSNIGPVSDCPSCSLRSEPAAGCFKAAAAPRGGRVLPLCARAGSRSAQVKTCWPASLPCSLSWIGPVKPPVPCRFWSSASKGRPARAGIASQAKEGTDMAKPSTPNRSNTRSSQSRRGTTLEMVRLSCPDASQASKIATSFGTAVVDSDGIRSLHERLIVETAESLSEGLGEKAMQIHLQRIVGAFVGSAHGAGQFYSRAVTEARDATAKASNDARDEDLDGPVGYDSAAQRKREFAADMGVQSHALRMAAEGAVAAYEQVIGETWKPFDRPVENPGASLDRKAAEAQLAAFG